MAKKEEVGVQNETGILDDGNGLDRAREIVDSKKMKGKKDKRVRRDNEEEVLVVTSSEKWDRTQWGRVSLLPKEESGLIATVGERGWLGGRCRVGEASRRKTSEEISGSRHYKEGDSDFLPVPQKKNSIADSEEEDPGEISSGQFFCNI
ncbi:hypothetical protein MRB53_000731 [Persea americana]|uniref:Uncharacterized protein n=1 Tax=Persea americana TaxID=3435 RepID=A0ACC2MPY3_PERAE|nr:hypothetical protein MRB53_000731 [Persea americana]